MAPIKDKMTMMGMGMLPWMCSYTRNERIKNEIIHKKVGVAPIKDKIWETQLKWFDCMRSKINKCSCKKEWME